MKLFTEHLKSLKFYGRRKKWAMIIGVFALLALALLYATKSSRYQGKSLDAWIDDFQMGRVSAEQIDEALANLPPSHEHARLILNDVAPRLSERRRNFRLWIQKAPRWMQNLKTVKNLRTYNHQANSHLLNKVPVLNLVEAASSSDDSSVRMFLLSFLALRSEMHPNNERLLNMLAEMTRDADAANRSAAMTLLRRFGGSHPIVENALITLLDDAYVLSDNRSIRGIASWNLMIMGCDDERAFEKLVNISKTGSPDEVIVAAFTLARNYDEKTHALSGFVHAWPKASDVYRQTALHGVMKIGREALPSALPLIQEALASTNQPLRKLAEKAAQELRVEADPISDRGPERD